MNELNESDVTKVTCVKNVTNVTCVTCVTNEFDETRFLSFLQSDSAASKAHFILSKRRRRRSNRVQRIFCGCCVRQTIRVSLKANAYCSALPVSEHVRGLSSLTWCVSCYISTSSPICDSQPFFYQAGNDVPQYMPSELHNYSANVNHFCLP